MGKPEGNDRLAKSNGSLSLALVATLLVLAVAGLDAVRSVAGAEPVTKVVVDRVRLVDMSQTMPVIGRFVARQSGVVAALTRGPVEAVLVDVGDRVERGAVLARLVPDRMRARRDLEAARVKEMEAALRTAEAQVRITLGELERLRGLRRSAAFSQARYNDKMNEVAKHRSAVREAEAALARARAELRLAEIDLHNALIRAPYGGVVVQRHTVAGAYVDVGDPVVTLINDEAMEIEADVPSDRLFGLVPGRVVAVRLDDGSRHEAVVRAQVPSENAMTRTRPVRFTPRLHPDAAKAAPVAANQSVTVLVPLSAPRRVVTVHKDAIIPRGSDKFVVVVRDGRAERRRVRLGAAVGERFEVTHGLEAGELAVIRGNERLRDGQAVSYDEPDPSPSG